MAEDIKISLQTTTPEIKVQSNTKATTSNIKNSQANIGIVTIGQTGATGVKGETGPAGSITAEQEAAIAANTAKTSYPSADSTKLLGISAGAEVNVKSDWNATSGDAEILNKPTIPTDTNTTYSVSCVDGENSDEEKIRLTDSSGSTDDVILEAGTGLSIARSGDKITFTNTVVDTDTVLTTEQVQDVVGAMFTSNTETRISAAYDDTDGTIDLVVDDMTADTNTQLTDEQVQDIVGAMVDGGTETNISVTYDDSSGKLNFVSTDTNTTYSVATGSSDGLMSSAHYSKLEEIEADADVTDTANVTAAGALMDSELTDLAGVKGVTISTLQVKPSEGAFADGDKTKLDAIEASADVTDATNVTAAGALMDSELTDLAGIKSLDTSNLVNLSGTQTIAGEKTFTKKLILDGDKSVTASGDGVAMHVDAQDITDTSTSGSGTATAFNHVVVENPRLMSTNSSVTTTNASTVYIKGAPIASTNQTITNAYSLYVAGGHSYFNNDVSVGGDLTVTGTVDGIDIATDVAANTAKITCNTANVTSSGALMDSELTDLAGVKSLNTSNLQIKSAHHHFIHAGFFMSYPYSRYIPLNGSINEQTTSTGAPEYTTFIWPYDGYVKTMWVRSETSLGSTEMKLYKGANSSTVSTAMGAVTETVGANTSVEFDMTGVTNSFSQGEAMAVRIDPTDDPDSGQNVTIELVFDLTT